METLNNIWNILTTENEFVSEIITFPLGFIEIYLSFCLFTTILKINYTQKQILLYVIPLSISSSIIPLILPNPFNVIINYAIMFIFVKYVFKLNILKSILATIIPFLIFGLVSSLIMNPFLKIFKITFEQADKISLYRFLYLSSNYIIVYIIVVIIRHIKININFNIIFDKRTQKTILINLILGLLTLFIQASLTVYYVSEVPIIFSLFNFRVIICLFLHKLLQFNKSNEIRYYNTRLRKCREL